MNRRKIIVIVILAIVCFYVLMGAYYWRENHIIQKEMEINKLYSTQLEEILKEESSARASQANHVKTPPDNNVRTPANLTTPTTPVNDKNPLPNPVPSSEATTPK